MVQKNANVYTDFDGDEMNVHAPQSYRTQAELKWLCAIANHLRSPKNGGAVIGLVQDALAAGHLLSREETRVNREIFYDAIMSMKHPWSREIPEPVARDEDGRSVWTGRQLLSMAMPQELNLERGKVRIYSGVLVSGTMNKKLLGVGSGSLVHLVVQQLGEDRASDFLDNLHDVCIGYLRHRGFTFGFRDISVPKRQQRAFQRIVKHAEEEVDAFLERITDPVTGRRTGTAASIESTINTKLNQVLSKAGKDVLPQLPRSNLTIMAIEAESKGKSSNIIQFSAYVGQQNVYGERIPCGLIGRTLPHFKRGDIGLRSRGFVEHPYVQGLTPQETFMHAAGGREGLVDTAIKSVTGDTPIVVLENGQPKRVLIGDWIDAMLADNTAKVQHFEEREMELLDVTGSGNGGVDKNLWIPTTDALGNVSWGAIAAVTRHDPGKDLYLVKTLGGRSVIVTESKSLLIWNEEHLQFVHTSTPEVKVGDMMPTTQSLPSPTPHNSVAPLTRENGVSVGLNTVEGAGTFPCAAYSAPREFVIGFLDAYFSSSKVALHNDVFAEGDGTEVHRDFIVAHANSLEVLEGIAFLLTRIGVFAQLDFEHLRLSISSQWAARFARAITLTCSREKQAELEALVYAKVDDDFGTQHDCVLDTITEITRIDPALYPKVYDLTVPSTLNFALANGLHVVDTAKTGYALRQITNALSDITVDELFAARTAQGNIVQFAYGGDNIDPCKLLLVKLDYATLSTDAFVARYRYDKYLDASAAAVLDSVQQEWEQLEKDRKKIQRMALLPEAFLDHFDDDCVKLSVDIDRLVLDAKVRFKCGDHATSAAHARAQLMHPNLVCERVAQLVMDVQSVWSFDPLLVNERRHTTKMLRVVIRSRLSSKRVIEEYMLSQRALDWLCNRIVEDYKFSIVQPGEAVGILSAQSNGEPQQQMTLNSVAWDTEIVFCTDGGDDGASQKIEIGSWIDTLMSAHPNDVQRFENDSEYLELEEPVRIPTVDAKGVTSWAALTAVTRHPPHGDMVKITTRSGRSVVATRSKSLLIWNATTNEFEQTAGAAVKVGDAVPTTVKLTDGGDAIGMYAPDADVKIVNQVALDEIVAIEAVDEALHPTVYDVTVPSTTNFILANGLGVADTFHFAGISAQNVTLGVPRIKEVIHCTREPKLVNTMIFMSQPYSVAETEAEKMAIFREAWNKRFQVLELLVRDAIVDHSIVWEPDTGTSALSAEDADVEAVHALVWPDYSITTGLFSGHVLRLRFDALKLAQHGLTFGAVAAILREAVGDGVTTLCMASDSSSLEPVFRMRARYSSRPDGFQDGMTEEAWKTFEHSVIHRFYQQQVENIRLSGLPRVRNVFIREDKRGGVLMLDTDCRNLQEAMRVDGGVYDRCECNHPLEVYRALGVEAARQSIIIEIRKMYRYYGINVDARHLTLIADAMTYAGGLMSLDRHGINHAEFNTLKKAAFEEIADVLTKAAIHAKCDPLCDNTSRIMMGQEVRVGTGTFDLILDREKHERLAKAHHQPRRQHIRTQRRKRAIADRMAVFDGMFGGAGGGGSSSSTDNRRPITLEESFSGAASSFFGDDDHGYGYGYADPENPFDYQLHEEEEFAAPPARPYSPTSNVFDYSGAGAGAGAAYSPSSPAYSPSSPAYSPSSPAYSPSSPAYSPSSPGYSGAGAAPYSPSRAVDDYNDDGGDDGGQSRPKLRFEVMPYDPEKQYYGDDPDEDLDDGVDGGVDGGEGGGAGLWGEDEEYDYDDDDDALF